MPWGNTDIYKIVSLPIKQEFTEIDKDGNKNILTISFIITFIDSGRFMATLLSSLVDTLTQGIRNIKCKDCDCFLECESVKENSIKYKSFSWNKNY